MRKKSHFPPKIYIKKLTTFMLFNDIYSNFINV